MQDWGRSTGLVRSGGSTAFLCGLAFALAGCVADLAPPETAQASSAASSENPVNSSSLAAAAEPKPASAHPVGASAAIDQTLAPDPGAFAAELDAVWDGLPTLQGIWIAHPLASRARRVRLTNQETGAQVDAALFRRDPNQGGPTTMISSEAAEKLGIEPGAETPITIVAISHVDQIMQPTGTVSAEAGAAGADAGGDGSPDAAPEGAADSVFAAADVDGTAANATPEAGDAPPEASNFAVAMAAPVNQGEAARMPATTSGTSGSATGSTAESAPGTGAVAPLAAPTAPPRLAAAIATPATRTDASAPAPLPATSAETAGTLTDGLPYIQAGIFGEPGNAERLVALLRENGLPAEARPLAAGERTLVRVLVGPFGTSADRDAALTAVRAIGPADATPVKG